MMFLYEITIHLLFSQALTAKSLDTGPQTRRILPADSYQLLGTPGFRQQGQCNITFAWLIPPPVSSLDAYGHALACTRLQLRDGRVVHSTSNLETDTQSRSNRPENELKHINKDLAATMADLGQLDALMRADQGASALPLSSPGNQLTDGSRYFYLADRIGNLNILVLLRPGQQIKLELIDPISPDHVFTPQHVLCSRKQCPITDDKPPTEGTWNKLSNSNKLLSAALLKVEKQNRDLYIQLIISRVACTLVSLLCIIFIVTALALCLRLRRSSVCYRDKSTPCEFGAYREQHPSPSYFQPNGNLTLGQPSPVFLTDASPRHAGLNQLPSETGSVSNIVMNTSNISEYAGLPITYAALGSQYGALTAYPVSAGRTATCNDRSGVVTFVPMNSRGILLPYQTGSTSPAPSHHSLNETKSGVTRTDSLGRYSASSMCYTDNGRRRLLQMSKPFGVVKCPNETVRKSQLVNAILSQQTSERSSDLNSDEMDGKIHSGRVASNLGSFHVHNSTKPHVVHRYPSDPQPAYTALPTTRRPISDDPGNSKASRSNHIQEPCVGLTKKPALVT